MAIDVELLFNSAINNNNILFTSTVTIMEFCTKPFELGNTNLVKKFEEFLLKLDFTLIPINKEVALEAAKLRSKYKSLKGMDALQLACAINNGCNKFITNDKNLKQVYEIGVELIDDY